MIGEGRKGEGWICVSGGCGVKGEGERERAGDTGVCGVTGDAGGVNLGGWGEGWGEQQGDGETGMGNSWGEGACGHWFACGL